MTSEQFLNGKPVNFKSFSGEAHVARFLCGARNGLGVPSLQIKNARGKTVRNLITNSQEAEAFFLNLDAA